MPRVRRDLLNGWKEIAAYLGRDPRTVERWEERRSLPVHRLLGSGRSTVYAFTTELDAWLAGHPPSALVAEGAATAETRTGAAATDIPNESEPPSHPRAGPEASSPMDAPRMRWLPGPGDRRRWAVLALGLSLLAVGGCMALHRVSYTLKTHFVAPSSKIISTARAHSAS